MQNKILLSKKQLNKTKAKDLVLRDLFSRPGVGQKKVKGNFIMSFEWF
jgi:hypothetical protein